MDTELLPPLSKAQHLSFYGIDSVENIRCHVPVLISRMSCFRKARWFSITVAKVISVAYSLSDRCSGMEGELQVLPPALSVFTWRTRSYSSLL